MLENIKKIVATIILCVLVGLILEYVYIESQPKDSDLDGWTDVEEQEAGTSPFDSDTDDDGIKDPEDPTPLNPGILTSDEQKLEGYKYLEYDTRFFDHIRHEDIKIPKGATMMKSKELRVGYGEARGCTYEINASAPQVMDFFLEKLVDDSWHAYPVLDSFDPHKMCNHMRFGKREFREQGEYVDIVVIGLRYEDDYSQFTIIYGYPT